ncbi:hypothetical protein L5515_003013 [Caenorhabditis briggsae]|uniref:Uncharacterized protein n=2 Tax=Caenorhabditis briggsae TaxID=6238 RepID=A0AAE9EGL0_CAEBR|nr:hypothetical protein L5515_003013 [Caenorhabditis briggsae]
MAPPSQPGMYDNTEIKTVACTEYLLHEFSNNAMTGWELTIKSNGAKIRTNLYLMDSTEIKKSPCQFFLVDDVDFGEYDKLMAGTMQTKDISKIFSEIKLCGKHHNRNLYLRCVPPCQLYQEEDHRVFVQDVVEIVPLIWEKQAPKNSKRLFSDKRQFNALCRSWETEKRHLEHTITLHEFKRILKILDCDASLVTVIEDPLSMITQEEMLQEVGFVRTCAPNLALVMNQFQSLFFVFHNLVNGVNWRNEMCKEHVNCNTKLQTKILKLLYEIVKNKDGTFYHFSYVMESVQRIKEQCPVKYLQPRMTPDYLFQHLKSDLLMPLGYYADVVEHYNILYMDAHYRTISSQMQVYAARFLIQLGWVIQFFDKEKDDKLARAVVGVALFFIQPEGRKRGIELINKILLEAMEVRRTWNGQPESPESLKGPLPGMAPYVRPTIDQNTVRNVENPVTPEAYNDACDNCKFMLDKVMMLQGDIENSIRRVRDADTLVQKAPQMKTEAQMKQKQIDELKQKIEIRKQALPQADKKLYDLKERNHELSQQMEVSEQRMTELTEKRRVCRNRIEEVTKLNEELKQRLAELVQAQKHKENEPNGSCGAPIEIQKKQEKIEELKKKQQQLETIVELQAIKIKDNGLENKEKIV